MRTIVAETVMMGREAFETLGEVEVVPDRSIGPQHLSDADALIIRSKTPVTQALLTNSSVRFVGTATAGFEHIDIQTLKKKGIAWFAAPGCNAASVADYVMAALLRLDLELEDRTLGIIGVGQVGSCVADRATALGLKILLNDPPRAARERENGIPLRDPQHSSHHGQNKPREWHSLEHLLDQSDILTLHVPLVTKQPWPTRHMANDPFFRKMKSGTVFVNTARGEILDTDALLRAKKTRVISQAVLDVWKPEPAIRTDLLNHADIATPHIAGHSLNGKLNGTDQVYRAACHFFKQPPAWDAVALHPVRILQPLNIDSRSKTDRCVLAEGASTVYDIAADDAALRKTAVMEPTERAKKFDAMRAHYPPRREFSNTQVILSEDRPNLIQKLRILGFKT